MKTILIIFIFILVIIGACNSGYIVNTQDKTNHVEGRYLYISKCNGCHQLYNPTEYTQSNWDSILVSMKMKAKLNDEQRDEVYNWIMEVKNIGKNSAISD